MITPKEIVERWKDKKLQSGDIKKTGDLISTKRPYVFFSYYIYQVRGEEREHGSSGYLFIVSENKGVQLIGWENGDANYKYYIS